MEPGTRITLTRDQWSDMHRDLCSVTDPACKPLRDKLDQFIHKGADINFCNPQGDNPWIERQLPVWWRIVSWLNTTSLKDEIVRQLNVAIAAEGVSRNGW